MNIGDSQGMTAEVCFDRALRFLLFSVLSVLLAIFSPFTILGYAILGAGVLLCAYQAYSASRLMFRRWSSPSLPVLRVSASLALLSGFGVWIWIALSFVTKFYFGDS